MATKAKSSMCYTHGQVVCPGNRLCQLDHMNLPGPDEVPALAPTGKEAARDMARMQYSLDTEISDTGMEAAANKLWDALPRDLGRRISCRVTPRGKGVWSSTKWGDQRWWDACRRLCSWTAALQNYEYLLWAFHVDSSHWVLAVVHLTDGGKRVNHIAVIDPATGTEAVIRAMAIETQVKAILEKIGGLRLSTDLQRDVWVPAQHDAEDNSDGPRIYWAWKETMRRLLQMYDAGWGYHEGLWSDHNAWFHEETARHEIINALAWQMVRGMDYQGRVAVEAVTAVRKDAAAEWEDSGPLMRPQSRDGDEKPKDMLVNSKRHQLRTMPEPPKRPVPPRSHPRIYPTFSMVKDDGLVDYDGWEQSPARAPAWNDPRRAGARPVPKQPPGKPAAT